LILKSERLKKNEVITGIFIVLGPEVTLLIHIRRKNILRCFLFAFVLVYDFYLLASSRKSAVLPAVLMLFLTICLSLELGCTFTNFYFDN